MKGITNTFKAILNIPTIIGSIAAWQNLFTILILLLILIPQFTKSQSNIVGVLIDFKTKEAIPYSNIFVKNNPRVGVISNEFGEFALSYNYKKDDTIIISNIVYQEIQVSISKWSKIPAVIDTIYLKPKSISLSSVVIKGTKTKIRELGVKKVKFIADRNMQFGMDGQPFIAVYIENSFSKKKDVFLKSAHYYLINESSKDYLYKVHIYAVDSNTFNPGKELLNANIVKKYPKSKGWVKVDLSAYNIKLPDNGFYIGIECLNSIYITNDTLFSKNVCSNKTINIFKATNIELTKKEKTEKLKKIKSFGLFDKQRPYIQATEYKSSKNLTWYKFSFGTKQWNREIPKFKNYVTDNACIYGKFYVYRKPKK